METISVTRKGVEKLINQLNEITEGLNVSAEYKNSLWIINIAERLHYAPTTLEAIQYLQGAMVGLSIIKQA